jgi:hypothetical protein
MTCAALPKLKISQEATVLGSRLPAPLLRRHGRNARSKIFLLEVDGRFHADAVKIGIEPFLGTRAACVMKVHQEIPIGVQPAPP